MKIEGFQYQVEGFHAQLSNYQFDKKPRLNGLVDFTVMFLGKQGDLKTTRMKIEGGQYQGEEFHAQLSNYQFDKKPQSLGSLILLLHL